MSQDRDPGFFSELSRYASKNKRWWLLPLILILVIFSALLIVAEIAPVISPFIYTLF